MNRQRNTAIPCTGRVAGCVVWVLPRIPRLALLRELWSLHQQSCSSEKERSVVIKTLGVAPVSPPKHGGPPLGPAGQREPG